MADTKELDRLVDQVADLIAAAERVVVFTGAGISTESGIPDFRGPGGFWERFDPEDFTYRKFLTDPAARRKHWQALCDGGLAQKAQPNAAHYAIAQLDRLGKLNCVITQNVDNLHQKAGLSSDKVFELHGNMQRAVCLQCGRYYPLEKVIPRWEASHEAPDCEACGGILKPAAVFFGEPLPQDVLTAASYRAQNCDLCIVIGSTLVVYPAAYMPQYAVEAGASLVIINLSPTPMDEQASVVIRARAGETLPEVVTRVTRKLGR